MPERVKVWLSIASGALGLLGTGWLSEHVELHWHRGVAHWPIMFTTRKAARMEARTLTKKFANQNWKFRPVKLVVTYRAR